MRLVGVRPWEDYAGQGVWRAIGRARLGEFVWTFMGWMSLQNYV